MRTSIVGIAARLTNNPARSYNPFVIMEVQEDWLVTRCKRPNNSNGDETEANQERQEERNNIFFCDSPQPMNEEGLK